MSEADRQLWQGMLAHLRRHHAALCRQWFEELQPLTIVGGALSLRATSDLHRDYLRRVCADAFNDSARAVSGHLLSIRFLGPDEEAPMFDPRRKTAAATVALAAGANDPPGQTSSSTAVAPAMVGAPAGAPAAAGVEKPVEVDPVVVVTRPAVAIPAALAPAINGALGTGSSGANSGTNGSANGGINGTVKRGGSRLRHDESLVINPDYDFENFVVGPENRLSYAAAIAVATQPGRSYNPLFVHGGVGLGKTHLLQAACLKLMGQHPDLVLHYTSCDSFTNRFMESVQGGGMSDFRHRFRDVDVLIIDDIHFLAQRERTQEEFFHTFNSLYQAGKQIVLSSDAAPNEIPQLEERLVSRFRWGLVTKLEPPCYETRVAILKTKSRLRGIALPDDVACHIAARIDSNIRELEGAIVRLQIQSSVENRPIDLDMARRALGDVVPTVPSEPSIQAIITAVTEFFRLRVTDLQSKKRTRSIAVPRQVCMFLARKNTRHSLEEIGGYFGGRDHTTVMHAIRTIEARRGSDRDFDAVLRTLEDRLRDPASAGA